jgi:hypothetical protein
MGRALTGIQLIRETNQETFWVIEGRWACTNSWIIPARLLGIESTPGLYKVDGRKIVRVSSGRPPTYNGMLNQDDYASMARDTINGFPATVTIECTDHHHREFIPFENGKYVAYAPVIRLITSRTLDPQFMRHASENVTLIRDRKSLQTLGVSNIVNPAQIEPPKHEICA